MGLPSKEDSICEKNSLLVLPLVEPKQSSKIYPPIILVSYN